MNKSIKKYEDLLKEEEELTQALRGHEKLIKSDIAGIKESLKPMNNFMGIVNKMATRDRTGPLVNFGLDFGIDILIRKFLLARAGWITKIVIPFLIKNYSSHLISEEKRIKLTKKIQDFLNKIRPKQHHHSVTPAT